MARVKGITVSPVTHTFIHEWNEPSFLYSQPLGITALWSVLISRPAEGRWLSGRGWLVAHRDGLPE